VIKSCLARIGCLTLAVIVLGAAWLFREDVARLWSRLEITSASVPSEEMADRAYGELEALLRGESVSVTLSQAEIQSLLTYRAGPLLPEGIENPVVQVRDSTMILSARVDPGRLEGLASPEVVERLFSDSARVVVELEPGVLAPGIGRIEVVALQAGAVAVPSLMIPWILDGLDLDGVQSSGRVLFLPTPRRVAVFEVRDGSLRFELSRDGAD
jgi:hypothetical protein